MRVTKEQAQASRQRIVGKAAELFRDRGFDGIGVADLMRASDMTHGGFYRHFSSKDDLAVEALRAAYDQLESETEGRSIDSLLRRYIAPEHRDDLATGCPTSALGSDAMRQAGPFKAVFAAGIDTWLRMIGDSLEAEREIASDDRRRLAIDVAARAVGAIILSRAASSNADLSDEILKTVLESALSDAKDA